MRGVCMTVQKAIYGTWLSHDWFIHCIASSLLVNDFGLSFSYKKDLTSIDTMVMSYRRRSRNTGSLSVWQQRGSHVDFLELRRPPNLEEYHAGWVTDGTAWYVLWWWTSLPRNGGCLLCFGDCPKLCWCLSNIQDLTTYIRPNCIHVWQATMNSHDCKEGLRQGVLHRDLWME